MKPQLRSKFVYWGLLSLAVLGDPLVLLAANCAPLWSIKPPQGLGSIKFVAGSGVDSSALAAAISKWNKCNKGPMPELKTSGAADLTINLEQHSMAPDAGCGQVTGTVHELVIEILGKPGTKRK